MVTTHLYDGQKTLPLDIELYQHSNSLLEGKKDRSQAWKKSCYRLHKGECDTDREISWRARGTSEPLAGKKRRSEGAI